MFRLLFTHHPPILTSPLLFLVVWLFLRLCISLSPHHYSRSAPQPVDAFVPMLLSCVSARQQRRSNRKQEKKVRTEMSLRHKWDLCSSGLIMFALIIVGMCPDLTGDSFALHSDLQLHLKLNNKISAFIKVFDKTGAWNNQELQQFSALESKLEVLISLAPSVSFQTQHETHISLSLF